MSSVISLFLILGASIPIITWDVPNFLVIVLDDVGYNDVSWNNPEMSTPHLHQLAEAGAVLDTFYSAPRCSPSRSALLTGLYPYKTGMQRGNISPYRPYGLPTRFKLLPEYLKDQGYSTHLIGKRKSPFIYLISNSLFVKDFGIWDTAMKIICQHEEVLTHSWVI